MTHLPFERLWKSICNALRLVKFCPVVFEKKSPEHGSHKLIFLYFLNVLLFWEKIPSKMVQLRCAECCSNVFFSTTTHRKVALLSALKILFHGLSNDDYVTVWSSLQIEILLIQKWSRKFLILLRFWKKRPFRTSLKSQQNFCHFLRTLAMQNLRKSSKSDLLIRWKHWSVKTKDLEVKTAGNSLAASVNALPRWILACPNVGSVVCEYLAVISLQNV